MDFCRRSTRISQRDNIRNTVTKQNLKIKLYMWLTAPKGATPVN